MTIGEKIKRYRKERGLTQKELGEKCGIADSAIRRYELNGARPKIETIQKIANALDIPVEYLFGEINLGLITENDVEVIEYCASKGEKDIQLFFMQHGYSLIKKDNYYLIQLVDGHIYGKKIKISCEEFNELCEDIDFFVKYLMQKLMKSHEYYFE